MRKAYVHGFSLIDTIYWRKGRVLLEVYSKEELLSMEDISEDERYMIVNIEKHDLDDRIVGYIKTGHESCCSNKFTPVFRGDIKYKK